MHILIFIWTHAASNVTVEILKQNEKTDKQIMTNIKIETVNKLARTIKWFDCEVVTL